MKISCSKSSPIGLLGAMDAEIEGYLSKMESPQRLTWREFVFYHGGLCGVPVVVAKSGVGKVLSAVIAQRMIDQFAPAAVLFTGIGGALNPAYQIGDLVLGRDALQHDMDASALGFKIGEIPYTNYRLFAASSQLLEIAISCPGLPIRVGRILTGDQFLTHAGRTTHDYLVSELEGDVIEMEGASVAFVCTLNSTPMLIARTISDRADGDAPADFLKFLPLASKNSLQLVQHILNHVAVR